MYYQAKNCKVYINGQIILANDLSLSVQTQVEGAKRIGEKQIERYVGRPYANTLNLTYLLTGTDPIKTYVGNRKEFISGNVGGLSFKNAAVSNYSINGAPNESIIANAQIVFYENVEGNFSPTISNRLDTEILNFKNIQLQDDFVSIVTNPISFNYQASVNVIPVYKLNNLTSGYNPPVRLQIDRAQSTLNFASDNLNEKIPFAGISTVATININNESDELVNSISISGVITSSNITTSNNNLLVNQITIREDTLALKPNVTGVFKYNYTNPSLPDLIPQTSFKRILDYVVLWGDNLQYVDAVRLGSQNLTYTLFAPLEFLTIDKYWLIFSMPDLGGNLVTISEAGADIYPTPLTILDDGIGAF